MAGTQGGQQQDDLGWMGDLGKSAMKQVSYQVLDWTNKTAIDEEKRQPTPGEKKQATSPNQFVNFLKDGSVLANLANKLSPGSVPQVYEGEEAKDKNKQTENINNFVGFLKDKAGMSDDQVFKAEDLQKKGGKGFGAVFQTLVQLATHAYQQFSTQGIDMQTLQAVASQAFKSGIFQQIMGLFRKQPAQPKPIENNQQGGGGGGGGEAPVAPAQPTGNDIEEPAAQRMAV